MKYWRQKKCYMREVDMGWLTNRLMGGWQPTMWDTRATQLRQQQKKLAECMDGLRE